MSTLNAYKCFFFLNLFSTGGRERPAVLFPGQRPHQVLRPASAGGVLPAQPRLPPHQTHSFFSAQTEEPWTRERMTTFPPHATTLWSNPSIQLCQPILGQETAWQGKKHLHHVLLRDASKPELFLILWWKHVCLWSAEWNWAILFQKDGPSETTLSTNSFKTKVILPAL